MMYSSQIAACLFDICQQSEVAWIIIRILSEKRMKTIGLIGGMSWESTVSYYQTINQQVKLRLGGFNSAKLCLYSVNFAEIEALQRAGEWQQMASILTQAASALETAGADFILICTNTMHKVADEVAAAINIPLIHIADATASEIIKDGNRKIALLGTRFTMEQAFYKQRLQDKYDIEVLVPNSDDQTIVHDIIYQELCQGIIKAESKQQYLAIIDKLTAQGAQGVILGCTEIGLLIGTEDVSVSVYDTAQLHAIKAVDIAIADSL